MEQTASTVIDALGGTSRVAEMCGVTTGAVSQWRTNGIPKGWLSYLKAVRPDAFGLPIPARGRTRKTA